MKIIDGRFLSAWLPVFLYCVLIFIVSSIPIVLPKGCPSFSDKIIHIFEYALLGILIARALDVQGYVFTNPYKLIFITELAFLYGASDELHQFFVPGRMASNLDILADGVGGFLGAVIHKKRLWLK